MLPELVALLRKPLAVEEKLGYGNSAVIGGLDGWMQGQTERALREEGSKALSKQATSALQRLYHQWSRYGDGDAAYRRDVVRSTLRTLDSLAAECDAETEALGGTEALAAAPVAAAPVAATAKPQVAKPQPA